MTDETLFIPRCTIAAFAKSDGVVAELKRLQQHHLLARAQYEVFVGDIDALVNQYPTGGTPELLIIEHDGSIEELDRVADISAAFTQIIVISNNNDVGRYRKLLNRGGSDYLFTPLTQELLLASLSRTFAKTENRPIGALHMFTGCGGGTGASTIAQNAAILLSQVPNKRVLLIDFDIMSGSMSLNFDISPVRGTSELLRDPRSITSQEIARIAHERNSNLQILCSSPTLEPGFQLRSDNFIDILDSARTLADHIVIDMPSGWSTLHTRVLSVAERVTLVTACDLRSFQLMRRIQDLSSKTRQHMSEPDLVLNRWTKKSESIISRKTYQDTLRSGRLIEVGDFQSAAENAAVTGKLVAELTSRPPEMSALVAYLQERTSARPTETATASSSLVKRLFGRGG